MDSNFRAFWLAPVIWNILGQLNENRKKKLKTWTKNLINTWSIKYPKKKTFRNLWQLTSSPVISETPANVSWNNGLRLVRLVRLGTAGAPSHNNYCLVFVGNVRNLVRTLEVTEFGRFFQRLDICSVRDTIIFLHRLSRSLCALTHTCEQAPRGTGAGPQPQSLGEPARRLVPLRKQCRKYLAREFAIQQ